MRRLGAGGMGEVYLAQHPRLPRQDALKMLTGEVTADPSFRERFLREADLASTLWHPHIVGVHDRGESSTASSGYRWISSMAKMPGANRAEVPTGMPVNLATSMFGRGFRSGLRPSKAFSIATSNPPTFCLHAVTKVASGEYADGLRNMLEPSTTTVD